ncbi:ISLre2 family transposase [Enterococcus sp. DIV1420a]|uniref:ISLre2 family transposase n=1 Tax=Enterococcus sp. DIV1420a TaxID=2774672 RepID=UPI003F210EAA
MKNEFIELMNAVLDDDHWDVLEKEHQLTLVLNQWVNWLVTTFIDRKEQQQRSYYLAQGYQPGKKAERTVQFLYGPITYQRTPWKKAGKIIYPIDQLLGLQPYMRYSPAVIYGFIAASKNGSLRNIAKTIQTFTLLSCSKDTIDKAIHTFGDQVKAYQQYTKEYGEVRKRQVPYLFIEGDGFLLSMKGQKKKDIAHFVIHEGKKQEQEEGRSKLKQVHEIVSEKHHYATEQVTDYLYRNYDLKETVVIINTDGGSGYGPTFMGKLLPEKPKRLEIFIDPYHVQLKLQERLFQPELFPVFKAGIAKHSREKINTALDTFHSCCETEEQEEHFIKLRAYLNRNWKYLKPYYLRDLPQDIYTLGIIESLHRAFTYRMKKQGRVWGKKGSDGLLQIIAAMKNQEIKPLFLGEWQEAFSLDDRLKDEPICGLEKATEFPNCAAKGRFHLQTDSLREKSYIRYLRRN